MKIKRQIKSEEEIEFKLIQEGKLKESCGKDSNNYVNNKELLAEFVEFDKKKKELQARGIDTLPRLSEKIGHAIIQICNRRCNSKQFVNYSSAWKEELISNAIMTVTIRCHNFNPEKSDNPFAYLTQICNNAILEQLKKEKKQLYVRYKLTEESRGFMADSDENINEEDFHHESTGVPTELRQKYIENYENSVFNKPQEESKEPAEENLGLFGDLK